MLAMSVPVLVSVLVPAFVPDLVSVLVAVAVLVTAARPAVTQLLDLERSFSDFRSPPLFVDDDDDV